MPESIPSIVFILFALSLFVQMGYYLFIFLRVAIYSDAKASNPMPPVSVVLCAKNEEDNLRQNLPLVLAQRYADFQVVVVNDGSWDETEYFLKDMAKQHANLHVVFIPESDSLARGKKIALTLGIKGARHELLVLTDADCRPNSENWLAAMAGAFGDEKQIVLGYSPYTKYSGILNSLIRYDTLHIGIQYLSMALAGLPYMGVGRNLGYTKKVYNQVGGFRKHYHLQSGDDDIFINQAANATNTTIQIDVDAHTISAPKITWKSFWRQKKRHYSTANQYRFVHKFVLLLYPLTSCGYYLFGITLLCFQQYQWFAIAGLAIRAITQITIFRLSMRKLGDRDLIYSLPLLEILSLTLSPIIYLSQLISRQKQWS